MNDRRHTATAIMSAADAFINYDDALHALPDAAASNERAGLLAKRFAAWQLLVDSTLLVRAQSWVDETSRKD